MTIPAMAPALRACGPGGAEYSKPFEGGEALEALDDTEYVPATWADGVEWSLVAVFTVAMLSGVEAGKMDEDNEPPAATATERH
jgi:hypothetical protein